MFFWNTKSSKLIESDDKIYLVLMEWCKNIDTIKTPAVIFSTKVETIRYLIKKSLPSPFSLYYGFYPFNDGFYCPSLYIVPQIPTTFVAMETSFGQDLDVDLESRTDGWSVKDLPREELMSAAGDDLDLQKIIKDYFDLRDEEDYQKTLPEKDRYKFNLDFVRKGEQGQYLDIINKQFDILPYFLKQKVMETLRSIMTSDPKPYDTSTSIEGTNLSVVLHCSDEK